VSERRIFRQSRYAVPPGSTEILLVRHGESEAYVEGEDVVKLDGHDDPPLAPAGQIQAEHLAQRLVGERIDAIWVTNLRRTAETAAPLAARTGLRPTVVAELREVHMGEWEGGTFRQRLADGDPLLEQMRAEERWDVIPGAESKEGFCARVTAGIEHIAAAHPDQRVVAVTHAGTIATIVSIATGARPFAFLGANNASITELVVSGDEWHVRSFNDAGHLRGVVLP
jgi:probable phosphoglycerate mutase